MKVYLSRKERDRRYKNLRDIMGKEDIGAILVIGNQNIGGNAGSGSFRYLTDFFIIYQYGVLLFFQKDDPVMLVSSELQRDWGKKHSWVDDVRQSSNYPEDAAALIRDRKLTRARIGVVGMDSFPARLYLSFREELSGAEFFDASSALLRLRLTKGEEEKRLLQEAARINDEAYTEVLSHLRPGVKEYEIVGILEGCQFRNGADRTFNLITSGPFPTAADGTPFQYHPWFPSQRALQKGDCVLLEVTTLYGGYWNQLVRAVSVGRENIHLARFHDALLKTIQAGLKTLREGMKTSDLTDRMAAVAAKEGFTLTPIMGHFLGLDLTEARLGEAEGQVVLEPHMAMVTHPTIRNKLGIHMFWGESYLTTENEPVKLNQADRTLLTV